MSDDYLIWSHEHAAWWGPNGWGYVRSMSDAGRFERSHALDVCTDAIPGKAGRIAALPDVPVRLADVEHVRDRYRGTYPARPPEAWE